MPHNAKRNHHSNITKLTIVFMVILLAYLISVPWLIKTDESIIIYGNTITPKNIIEIIIWLFAAHLANVAFEVFIWQRLVSVNHTKVPALLKSAVKAIIFLLAIIGITFWVLQKSIFTLIATTGALGLFIGFSLRNVIDSAIQGVSINIQKIFKPGDIISIPGKFDELAAVKDITICNTYLEDFVGNIIAIPNNFITSNVVRNYSHPEDHIFSIYFNITISARGLCPHETILILTGVMESTDFIVSFPTYHILIAKVDSTQIKYNISCWAAKDKVNPLQAKHLLYLKIIDHLSSAGIDIGMPASDDEQDDNDAMLSNTKDQATQLQSSVNKKFLIVLKRVGLLRTLSSNEILALGKDCQANNISAGSTILNLGEANQHFYILVEGVLQVYYKDPTCTSLIPSTKLSPGNYLGEQALLNKEDNNITIKAITEALIYSFPLNSIKTMLKKHPEILEKINMKYHNDQKLHSSKAAKYHVHQHHSHDHPSLKTILTNFKSKIFGKLD